MLVMYNIFKSDAFILKYYLNSCATQTEFKSLKKQKMITI